MADLIWISSKGFKLYEKYNRTIGTFTIPNGFIARLRLFAAAKYKRWLTFTFTEVPPSVKGYDQDCYSVKNVFDKLRETCNGCLGEDDPDTVYNDYNRSLVYLGESPTTVSATASDPGYQCFRESLIIEWPGTYIIELLNCGDERMAAMADCVQPMVVAMTLIPAHYAIQNKCMVPNL